jgi:hypothetical protein
MGYIKSKLKPVKAEVIQFDDVVTIGIPLFIRLLELAREDIKEDCDLHFITEKVVDICKEEPVATMDDYKDILEYLDNSRD